jgi:hypothetical protein
MKKIILTVTVIAGCLMLAMMPALSQAQEKPKLMPMLLDGTEWEVEVISENKKGEAVTDKDTLLFKDQKFISTSYQKKGYTPSNYSLIVSEDDVTSFGTMQLKDKETSFWKGDVTGDTINGSLHVQYPDGTNETKYYSGKLTVGTLTRKTEEAETPAVEAPVVPQVLAPVVPVAEPVIVEEDVQLLETVVDSQAVENK